MHTIIRILSPKSTFFTTNSGKNCYFSVNIGMIGVISGYRTGSSSLIKGLAQLLHFRYDNTVTGELDFDNGHYVTPHSNDMIYKFMPNTMNSKALHLWDKVHEDWLSKSSLIFTLRHDVSAQIKSFYLANETGWWHNTNLDPVKIFNELHGTDYQTTDEINEWLCDNMDETRLNQYVPGFIQNLKLQYELYNQYGGIVSVLERRQTVNEKYTNHFRIPPKLLNWHCGFTLDDYFPSR